MRLGLLKCLDDCIIGEEDAVGPLIIRRIRDILQRKGRHVCSISPQGTVLDAVQVMNDHHIGAVLVIEEGRPIGVFSERDVLVRVVAAHRDPRQTLVRDVMTAHLYTASPDDSLLDVMRLMTDRRCRHIPVLDGGRLVGLVSIGDLAKATERNLRQEVRDLSRYIGGPYLA
ncbi:MAG: CBS domain-containing protein [Myxococcales bacterium]